jgi:hypothetical protein
MALEYARYLLSKRTVDDRALNRVVADSVRSGLSGVPGRVRVLEVGAGVGTMVARMVDWQILRSADYLMLDSDQEGLAFALEWLASWAAARGFHVVSRKEGLHVSDGATIDIDLRVMHAEVGAFLEERRSDRFDLLVANAVLDVLEITSVLPRLLDLLSPRGRYWLSINFDGETVFLPEDSDDEQLLSVYHQSMNQRPRMGSGGGSSKTGRRLFGVLRSAGAEILEAGSSDWVVFAGADGYPYEERQFLERILHTIQSALSARPAEVAPEVLRRWMETRRAQLLRGDLVYIAHQLDFTGVAGAKRV